MKIKKINNNNYKLLKLKLIKTKVHKKTNNSFLKIEDLIHRLKKALHVIYKYHINNKQIMFIGTPANITYNLKRLKKRTRHIFIPEAIWVNGLISNKTACFRYISNNQKTFNNKMTELLFQMKKKSDLVVILNQQKNIDALNESYMAEIPVISLNAELNLWDTKSTYKVPGNFQFTRKKLRDNFFYSLLHALFLKADLDEKKLGKLNKPLIKRKNKFYDIDK